MENREFFKKPLHVFLLAMLCCTLWGSAAPFIKWGYKLFNIEGVPSILMFAGIFFKQLDSIFSIILDFHIHQESTDPLFQEPVPLYLC